MCRIEFEREGDRQTDGKMMSVVKTSRGEMNRGEDGETAADWKNCGCASERERERKGKESKCAASNLRGRETDRRSDREIFAMRQKHRS